MTIDDLLTPPPPPASRTDDEDDARPYEAQPRPIPWPKQYGRTARAFVSIGQAFALALDVLRLSFKRPVQWREFVEQLWFVASVSILPAALVSIPFGAVIALQLGTLTIQLGAQSFTGAAAVLAVVQQASPIVVALMIAGAAGTAICADLGARTIREEIDAMAVLGVSPVHRLIVPRVWACVLVAVFLNGMVSVVGVAGGYVFNVLVQGGTPGAYLSSFSSLAQISDLYVGEIKAVVFGFLAAVVASYRGLHPRPGPKGVGDAVNESVVITFILLFLVNLGISTLYLRLVPSKIS
jgi:ABC transport permease subunit